MTGTDDLPRDHGPDRILLVTGPSGAGRSTAINALEDLGYEVIDNLPLSLLGHLVAAPPIGRPLALGIDVRNRDFGVDALIEAVDQLSRDRGSDVQILYLDCEVDQLVSRYSETRRNHPLSPDGAPLSGIITEKELLAPIRSRADFLIDTSKLTPHDLKAEVEAWFGIDDSGLFHVTVQSFSYRRGLPRGADLVFDCRFLANPHWVPELRGGTGLRADVADHVAADPAFGPFRETLLGMLRHVLPAHRREGRSHVAIAFGCTGGRHRSVAVTEMVAATLAEEGWRVSKRHRELERLDGTRQAPISSEKTGR